MTSLLDSAISLSLTLRQAQEFLDDGYKSLKAARTDGERLAAERKVYLAKKALAKFATGFVLRKVPKSPSFCWVQK
ncbi:MAG: hypothetical protein WCC53_10840 [Thermoanaerobaculia bacterium]